MQRSMGLCSLVAVLGILSPYAANAQSSSGGMNMKDHGGMDMKSPSGAVHQGSGVVKEVDKAKGTVAFAHEAIQSIGWPAMTMGFKVKDPTLLDKLSKDQRVRFDFVQEGQEYVVTSVK